MKISHASRDIFKESQDLGVGDERKKLLVSL